MAESIQRTASGPWMFPSPFDLCLLLGISAHIEAFDAAIHATLQSPHWLQTKAATAPWVDGMVVRRPQRTQP